MRYRFIIPLLLLLGHSAAYAEVSAPSEAPTFSQWQSAQAFEHLLNSLAKTHYPAAIQAKALLGDGVAFRAELKAMPAEGVRYHVIYGASAEDFAALNQRYTAMGFVLADKHSIQVQGGVIYQGVWIFI